MTNRNKFGYPEACYVNTPLKLFLTRTEAVDYSQFSSDPAIDRRLITTETWSKSRAEAGCTNGWWEALEHYNSGPGSARLGPSEGPCSSTQDAGGVWSDQGDCAEAAATWFFDEPMTVVTCNENNRVEQDEGTDITVDMLRTTTTVSEYTDALLRTDILSIMPDYGNWGEGSAAFSTIDSSHTLGSLRETQYKFKLEDTEIDTIYVVSWDEVTYYPDDTSQARHMSERVPGNGDPATPVYSSVHEDLPPQFWTVASGGTISIEIENISVEAFPLTDPNSGGGGGGGGRPGNSPSSGTLNSSSSTDCASCTATQGQTPTAGAWANFSMGTGLKGSSLDVLSFWSGKPETNFVTSATLSYATNMPEVDAVWENGNLRQVKAPQALADIVTISEGIKFEIRYYYASQVGSKNGTYGLTGSPYMTWVIENPDSSGATWTQVRISELRPSLETNVYNYSYASANKAWTLSLPGGLGEREESIYCPTPDIREETTVYRSTGGQVVLKEKRRFQRFIWGSYTIELPVSVTMDPDNTPKSTTYVYYGSDTPFTPSGSLVPLKLLTRPDGSWEYYQYDSSGRKTAVYSGVGNLACDGSAVPNANQCRLVQYFYGSSYVSGSGDTGTLKSRSPRLTIETLLGAEVARSYLVVLPGEQREIRCQTPTAAWGATDNLITTRKYFTSGANLFRLQSVKYPDGTIVIYDYAGNGYGGETTTILSGQPNAGGTSILDGVREVTVRDGLGFLVSRVTTDFLSQAILASQGASLPDAFGRPQLFTFLDGTFEEFGTGCCGPLYRIDRDGVSTTNVYDPAKRLTGTIRLGVTQTNLLDAAGNVLQTIRFVPNKSPVILRQTTNDLSGSIIAETNALGGRTTFSESTDGSGQKVRTATYPDGGTRIETYFRDGSLASRTGTAGQPVRYEYGVTGNSPFTKEIRLLSPTTDSSEWICNYTDLMGRNFKTVYAAASGTPKHERFFNAKGQLEKETDPDLVTTLYRYNLKGERVITAVDVNADSKVGNYDPGASDADRVTQTTSVVLANGATGNTRGMDIRRTETVVWTTASSAATAKVSTIDASPNGLHTWQLTYRDQSTTVTRQTDITIPTSGNAWTRTITQKEADGSSTVTTSQNGRTVSVSRMANGGAEIGRTTYGYDAEGHPYQVTDLRNGTATQTYNAADMVVSTTTPSPGMGQPGLITTTDYDNSLRPWRTTQPDGTSITNKYDVTGLLTNTFGSRTYPVAYSYDYAGRMQTMKTWTNFNLGNGAAVTTWNYNQYRGWLGSKRYADTSGPDYTYTAGGRLKTRQWARIGTLSARIQTTYTYGFDDGNSGNDYGDLVGISYANDPQSTAAVTYTYDRRGRQSTVSQGSMTTTLLYNDANQLTSESYSGGTLADFTTTTGYDTFLRRNSLSLNTAPALSVSYGYDSASRLQTVTMGSQSATYSYVANSPLVDQIVFKNSTTPVMTTSKSYDYLNRLKNVTSAPTASSTTSFAYEVNTAGQRYRVQLADGSYWLYEYDTLGQVKSGKKYWNDGTPVGGQQFEYGFDDIGNRTSTRIGGDANGQNLRAASYTANNLNQYSSRSVTGAVYVTGMAPATKPVTVNTLTASRKSEYFWKEYLTNNSPGAIWMTVTASATAESDVSGNVFIPKTAEQFSYDADGNLTNDGRWAYTWDAENRLLKMEPSGTFTPPANSKRKLEFSYDYMGRRIYRKITNLDTSTVLSETKCLYDGWNLLAELTMANGLVRSYAWGTDLSGTDQGAGGVGGLLKVTYYGPQTTNAFVAFDGNGNVGALVDAANGSLVARYEYGPFGEVLRATGPMAKANPIRFSTQYTDDETDLVCYLHRYYNPSTGRWLSRDPLNEPGFRQWAKPRIRGDKAADANPYRLLRNDAIGDTDYLGLWYNILTHCCCKGKLVPRASRGTGVYKCSIPFGHDWVFVADQPGGTTGTGYGWYSKELVDKTNEGHSCGSAKDAVSEGVVVDDRYNPDHCKEIKLRPCSWDIDKFRQEVANYFANLKGQTYIFMVFDCRQAANGAIDKATVKSLGCTSK